WTKWQITFPKLPGTIGDGEYLYPLDELIEIGIKLIGNEFSKIIHVLQPGCLGSVLKILKKKPKPNHNSHEKYLSNLEETIFKIIEHPIEKRLMAMAILYKNHEHYHDGNTKSHASFIHSVKKWIWDHIGDLVSSNPELLRVWCSIDFGLSVLKGIIEDGVLSVKDNKFVLDFTLINHIDFESWLVLHGADEKYLKNFPAVKSMYDGPFAFFKGAVSSPNVEAGTALNIFLRLALTCKQDVMWRMQAGMGDTIFAPIYEYLQINFKENVKFKFFHKIKDLQLDKDAQQVVSIEVEELIELADNISEYQPLVNVKGLQCWPSHPLYDQLNPDQVAKIKEQNIHIESNWSGWKGTMHTKNLNEDFDTVIIGASLSALPTFCTQLINNNQKWAKMLDKVGTVQTQAFQLWFTKSAEDLGVDPLQVLSTYVEPLDTFAAMNQVLEREDWSKYPEQPKYLMYVCGAFPDSESIPPAHATYFPKNQKNDVYDNMLVYIKENLKFIIPKAFDEDGNFDWDLL
ncbi:MAG TPA: hypothetical protein PKD85_18580, partial [Saprospiraceae bacterium]|nr:hypothetical protein [Saprospiraceae bacterium]